MSGRRLLALLWLSLALPWFSPHLAQGSLTVRVLIKEENPRLEVSAEEGLSVVEIDAQKVIEVRPGGGPLVIAFHAPGLVMGGRRIPAEALEVRAVGGGPLKIDGRSYRGFVEVRKGKEGKLLVINVLDLEDYIQGVMKEEISPRWPLEAMKAQAVVARTYALYQVRQNPGAPFHLRATTASQVYIGLDGEDSRSNLAVRETVGLILIYQGKVIPAFYHACSGGHTEDASDVWGGDFSYLVGVADGYCTESPHLTWEVTIEIPEIRRALLREGYVVGDIYALEPLERSRSGRIKRLRIRHSFGALELEGKRLRQILGNDLIRSTSFTVTVSEGVVKFQGKGWGHGVGLCQWGAKGMAERAYNFEEILKYYYPLAELKRLE